MRRKALMLKINSLKFIRKQFASLINKQKFDEKINQLKNVYNENEYINFDEKLAIKLSYLTAEWELAGDENLIILKNKLSHCLFYEGFEHPRIHLMYICVLFELGYIKSAKAGLENYLLKFGKIYIHEYLPACFLFNQLGLTDDVINKAGEIFEHIENNRKNKLFEKYILDKSIAVVGNSPTLLEYKLGKEIDSRDVVFRMNLFQFDPEFAESIGSKLDVYVTNANTSTIYTQHQKNAGKYKWIYVGMDLWHIHLSYFTNSVDFINIFYDVIKNTDCKIIYSYPEYLYKLKKETELKAPTTGLRILYYLSEIRGQVLTDEIYGFSESLVNNGLHYNKIKKIEGDFFNESTKNFLYFGNVCGMDAGHNINEEYRIRLSILRQRGE